MERVVVGLSGGVDSSVAAYILQQQGYEVVGLFMRNWHESQFTLMSDCSYDEDVEMAEMVANKLQIPFHQVDLSEPYKQRVVDYMFAEYQRGRTPNPDILCNREIKFDLFTDEARKLGADKVATGHYARLEYDSQAGQYRLLAGTDSNKDQSYFLAQLSQKQLATALFPIGDLPKPRVREIAADLNLPTATRKDSQGICFIGKVSLPDFLQQQLKPQAGSIIEIAADSPVYSSDYHDATDDLFKYWSQLPAYTPEAGKVVGQHQGAHYFTNGQRKGLHVGGMKAPLFVIHTDTQNNIVYTGQGKKHPGLFRKALFMETNEVHWIRPDLALQPGENQMVKARIRYRQPLQDALLWRRPEGFYLLFRKPQRAITPGQFAAWYLGDEIVGSGVIDT